MKFQDPEYRVAELAVLIELAADARSQIENASTEQVIVPLGITTNETREYAVMALSNLSDKLHDMLYDIAKEYIPREK